MAKTTAIYQPKGFDLAGRNLVNADGTSAVDVFTATADDSTVKSIALVSNDTSARNVDLSLYDGSNSFAIGTVAIGAYTSGPLIVADGLAGAWLPLDRVSKKVLPLKAGTVLRAAAQTAVTSGKSIAITVIAEDY